MTVLKQLNLYCCMLSSEQWIEAKCEYRTEICIIGIRHDAAQKWNLHLSLVTCSHMPDTAPFVLTGLMVISSYLCVVIIGVRHDSALTCNIYL